LEAGSLAGAYGTGSVYFNGVVTSPMTFRNASNSTNAFSVQTSAGYDALVYDTLNDHLKVYDGAGGGYVDIYYSGGNAYIGASSGTTNIGNGTGPITLLAGTGSNVNIDAAASASVLLGTVNNETVTVGSTSSTSTITVGQSTAGETINIGNGNVASGNTNTINIGATATSTGKDVVTIGSTVAASSLTLQAGTGNMTLTSTGKITFSAGTATGTSATIIVLPVKTDSGDPTSLQTAGAMYYNSNTNKFRCYENSAWVNCLYAGQPASVTFPDGTLGTSVTWTNMPAAVTEFAGATTRRFEVDLTGTTHWQISMEQSAAAASGALLGLEYSSDGGTTWKAIDSDTTNAQSTTTDALTTSATGFTISGVGTIHANAQTTVQIRVVGSAGNGTADPAFRNGVIRFW
jgi:hypothetical protein